LHRVLRALGVGQCPSSCDACSREALRTNTASGSDSHAWENAHLARLIDTDGILAVLNIHGEPQHGEQHAAQDMEAARLAVTFLLYHSHAPLLAK